MEKISKHIVLLFCLFLTGTVSAQSWVTGITFDYQANRPSWDSNAMHNVTLNFPTQSYDETFHVRLNQLTSSGFYIGFKNKFIFNKNAINADLSLGLNFYDYEFQVHPNNENYQLDGSTETHPNSDSAIWENYAAQDKSFMLSGTFPSFRLNVGYERELFKFKNLVFYGQTGLLLQRRISFLQDFETNITDINNPIEVDFSGLLQQKALLFSNYLGISLRYNSHVLGIDVGTTYGSIDHAQSTLDFKETFARVSYTKLFRASHLGKEQILYDEYQHLSQTKAAEYRKGDKYSYFQFGFNHQERAQYANDSIGTGWILQNGDSVMIQTEGYYVSPNLGFELMLNTYFTHRWMAGLGVGLYQETYYSYGSTTDPTGTEQSFGDEVLNSNPNNEYQYYKNRSKGVFSINTAWYLSKRIMVIDPYLKGSGSMVMNYDVPDFLKQNPDWRGTSFFPVVKVGAGIDIRMRLKSSKFFVLGICADYNVNPHVNYLQYSVRIGYYRKKKLKNQTY